MSNPSTYDLVVKSCESVGFIELITLNVFYKSKFVADGFIPATYELPEIDALII